MTDDAFDGFDLTEPDPITPPRTPDDRRVTIAGDGLAITLDLPALLHAMQHSTGYIGTDPDGEARYDSTQETSFAGMIAAAGAQRIMRSAERDIVTAVRREVTDAVTEQVAGIVAEALREGVQQTNTWGEPTGQKRPLRDLIIEQTQTALSRPVSNSMGGRGSETMVAKIVREEVAGAFKRELVAEVDKARNEAIAAVQAQAAEVIKETVQRASRGL